MESKTDNLKTFVRISSLLTGYDEIDLETTGMITTYYNCVISNAPQDSQFFFDEVRALLKECGNNEDKINAAIALHLMPLSAFNALARSIIAMWYLGNWNGVMVCPEAYVQGLVWPNANTHPYGAKQPGYGSWAEVPVSVSNH